MQLTNYLLDYTTPWRLPNVYIFTGNSTIKKNGATVMGRGAAKEVRDNIPGVDLAMGNYMRAFPEAHLLFLKTPTTDQIIGWFKVKDHWYHEASLQLIKNSVNALTTEAICYPDNYYHMNYPGIGNGKLDIKYVAPLLELLPDNVLLYRAADPHYFEKT
jgi:hypothetical protein